MARFTSLSLAVVIYLFLTSGCEQHPDSPPSVDAIPSASIDPSTDVLSVPTTDVPLEPPGSRDAERSRRAQRPADPTRKVPGRTYDSILEGKKNDGTLLPGANPAEPRPLTSCHSIEPAPKNTDYFAGPHRVHEMSVAWFETRSGFGFWRMQVFTNERGIQVGSRAIDRVELVSLLTDYEPSVYVLDEMATPALARQAKRRQLDEFERLGLEAVRRGEDLVWTREAPTRMFGAIRAKESCLECHVNAKTGDLLGAFTYYLNKPVDSPKLGSE
jgi:hypothetical protein